MLHFEFIIFLLLGCSFSNSTTTVLLYIWNFDYWLLFRVPNKQINIHNHTLYTRIYWHFVTYVDMLYFSQKSLKIFPLFFFQKAYINPLRSYFFTYHRINCIIRRHCKENNLYRKLREKGNYYYGSL